MEKSAALEKIALKIRACRKCGLSDERIQAVPGDGSPSASLMMVGEGPGRQEDEEGKPFVGAAGRLLNELLVEIGLAREEIYITNVVKCRPPGNRDPLPGEKEICLPYLREQVALIHPRLICPLGNHALSTLLKTEETISRMHGRAVLKGGLVFFPLYHPAAALYNVNLRKTMEKDFANLAELLKKERILL